MKTTDYFVEQAPCCRNCKYSRHKPDRGLKKYFCDSDGTCPWKTQEMWTRHWGAWTKKSVMAKWAESQDDPQSFKDSPKFIGDGDGICNKYQPKEVFDEDDE